MTRMWFRAGRGNLGTTVATATTLLALLLSASALAETDAEACRSSAYEATSCAPGWELTSDSYPTNLPPGGKGVIVVDVFNVGAGASHGPITLTDRLPAGVTAREEASGEGAGEISSVNEGTHPSFHPDLWECTGDGAGPAPKIEGAHVITCTSNPQTLAEWPGGAGPPNNALADQTLAGGARPNEVQHPEPRLGIAVNVASSQPEGEVINRAAIAGGDASNGASTESAITVSSAQPGFGITEFDGWFGNPDGTVDTQAGSHPYEATLSFDLAATAHTKYGGLASAGGELKDVELALPAGLVGNPTAVPQCPRAQLIETDCPAGSQVGVVTVVQGHGFPVNNVRLYNMVPPAGTPAEFAFALGNIMSYIDPTVRTGSDYGLTARAANAPERGVIQVITTLWGTPGDSTHNLWRSELDGGCDQLAAEEHDGPSQEGECKLPGIPPKQFLTLPTSCPVEVPVFKIRANSWEQPGSWTPWVESRLHDANDQPTTYTGCEGLAFGPTITTSPDTASADTPAGLTVEVNPPVGGLESVGSLSTADIKGTEVTLPEGVVVNPGQAAGLQACQESESGIGTEAASNCPLASKVGTVTAKTPLIEGSAEKEFKGNIYVLQSNPPNLKLLIALSADGVNIKQVLNVHLNETTGRLTTTVANFPQDPVTNVTLTFSGGPQAALDTPTQCGSYQTNGVFEPWASPFISNFATTAAFNIVRGPGGGPCPTSPLPFTPTLTAGSTTDQAGGYTDFSLLLQRDDAQQRIEKLSFKVPQGLSGMISSVPLCDEADANAGTCPAASHIGHAVVSSGPGPYPLVLPQPGEPELPIYLTGPYQGAPFGLSIVTPVLAGPFNLGTIVTRAKIEVDPHTAQITVTTNPLPQIVAGVPTDLRSIDAVIDRPGFMFNPTNCDPQTFSGTATSAQGAQAPISTPFGVGSCRSLEFKPKFAVSTSGKTSKAKGASLHVKLTYPSTPEGTEANIARVKVDLPKALPSRLKTLQKACLARVFEANPAACPSESVVGHARAITPLLPVPLEGPAYFVSHGGEAFPSLIMVLQGYGVTVDLVGATFISKAGITSSTFKTVPDVPVRTFELNLPEGRFSALAANGNLCSQKLAMPTAFLGQNGAEIHESTPIGVAGCAKAKASTRAQKLAQALKACHRKPKGKRGACESQARRTYAQPKTRRKG